MPAVKQIYRGAVTYTAASGANPTAIVVGATSAVDINNCVVMYTTRNGDTLPRTQRHAFTATLLVSGSDVTLNFSRFEATSATTVEIEWTVTEYESSALAQAVQRGEVDRVATTTNVAITPVNEAASGIFTTWKTSASTGFIDPRVAYTCGLTTNVTARDQLSLVSGTAPTTGVSVVAWQVAEFNAADIITQHGETAFTSNTNGTAAITPVTLANACVALTGTRFTSSQSGNRPWTRVKMNSASELGLNSQIFGSAVTRTVSWSVFEFLDGARVEKGEILIANAATTPTQPTFTAMDLTRAAPFTASGFTANGYNTSTTADGNVNSACVSMRVAATGDELTLIRVGTAQPFEIGWAVVEWAEAGGGGGVTGTVAYTNANDTSSASGTTTVTGSVAYTNANDTSAASGTTTVTGASATTNADDTASATGSPVVDGVSATTNVDDVVSASGSVGSAIVGTVAYTNIDDTASASGTTTVVGTAAASNGNDTSSADGTTTIVGSSATTNADDVCAATGTVEAVEIIGTVAVTNADDVSTASGTTTIVGSSATTNANDTVSAYGVVNNGTIVEAGLTTGSVSTIRIKKPGIPVGTPDWLKTTIEIVTGRRGNKIEVPKFQTLEFTTTPTKAEVEALYAYTNIVRDSLEQLINRMDG